jgi:hypothetical protein
MTSRNLLGQHSVNLHDEMAYRLFLEVGKRGLNVSTLIQGKNLPANVRQFLCLARRKSNILTQSH